MTNPRLLPLLLGLGCVFWALMIIGWLGWLAGCVMLLLLACVAAAVVFAVLK